MRTPSSRRSSLIVGVLILMLCHCTFGSDDGDRSTGPTSTPPAPNPLDVSIRTDAAHARTETIGPKGGGIGLHLPDGTDVQLTIPPGALPFEEQIGMAPVDAIEGWDFAPTGLAAVQLSPDGLELLVPGSLTFQRPATAPESRSGQISWAGEGTDLHPILGAERSDGVEIPIEHFSGYGFTWNLTMGYWGEWQQYRARESAAWFESDLVIFLNQARQKQLMVGEDPDLRLDDVVMGPWYDYVYVPLMSTADTSCANGRAAAIVQLTMARKIALAGGDISDIWQRFSETRRSKGLPLPFTFDGFPFDFIEHLVDTCDREALEKCLLTGDLGLLMMYIRDRNTTIDLSGRDMPSAGDGSDLIKKCARYHVDLDVTFAVDKHVDDHFASRYDDKVKWRVRLGVDLRWVPAQDAGAPWIGQLMGEAVPEWIGLGAQHRDWRQTGSDQGGFGRWGPWCVTSYAIGPWPTWPVELKELEFDRERPQRPLPPPLPYVVEDPQQTSERLGPTFSFEAPLTTVSFTRARILFQQLYGPREDWTRCGASGSDLMGYEILQPFVDAQPPDTTWSLFNDGLSEGPVELREPGSGSEIARRVWTQGAPPITTSDAKVTFDWFGDVTLTHATTA